MKRALVIWFFVTALVAMGCSPLPDNLDSVGSVETPVDSDPWTIQLLGDHTDIGTMVASGVLSTPYARQLSRTSDGALYCVYYRSDGTHTQIYGSKSVDDGETWTEEQITTAPLYHYQPSVAIDSDDSLHVAWIVFPDGDPIDQSYGYLWPGYPGYPGRVSKVQYRIKTSSWQSIEDVKTGYHTVIALAVDSENNVNLVTGGNNPGSWNCEGIHYAKRTASGWWPVERVSSGCWTGITALAVDENNNIHVVYSHAPYSEPRVEIVYRQRTSSGWASEVQLQSFDNHASGGISIAVDNNNHIHVVWGWRERQGDHYGIRYRRFTTYWHPIEMIEGPTLLQQNMPIIAIDGNDHIHVIWSGRHVDSPDLLQLRYREYASAWQLTENLTSSTSDDQANPNLMWASHPAVAGVKTNQMEEGYSLVWMDGTTIRYWSSTLIVDYDLTIASTEGGSVSVPGEGTFAYEDGTVADLLAVPDTGYEFVKWTGDVSTIVAVNSASTTITMNGDYSITANFAEGPPPVQYSLTISSGTGGSVTTPGEGTFNYNAGTVVNLVASPVSGYGFVNWTGHTGTIANPNLASTTITMYGNYSITANFEPIAGVQTQCAESATDTGTACFTTSHGFIEDLQAVPPHSLPSVLFPHGMFSFKITGLSEGQTVTLTIEFPSPLPIGTLWWKYDNGRWYGFPNGNDNGDNIMVIKLTDGGVGDMDDIAGQITDPGGPGNPMTVGWEGSPINKAVVLAPWIALLAIAIAVTSLLALMRPGMRRIAADDQWL